MSGQIREQTQFAVLNQSRNQRAVFTRGGGFIGEKKRTPVHWGVVSKKRNRAVNVRSCLTFTDRLVGLSLCRFWRSVVRPRMGLPYGYEDAEVE